MLTPFISRSLARSLGFSVSLDIMGGVLLVFSVTRLVVWRIDGEGPEERNTGERPKESRSTDEEEEESLVTVVEMSYDPSASSI